MSKQKDYLIQRGNTWYARMGIPEDVRHELGHKREYIQSLRTPDRNAALIKSKSLIAEWKNAIHMARGTWQRLCNPENCSDDASWSW